MIDLRKRDLKARLSEHLERVARGEVITVTSPGRHVVRIVPVLGATTWIAGRPRVGSHAGSIARRSRSSVKMGVRRR